MALVISSAMMVASLCVSCTNTGEWTAANDSSASAAHDSETPRWLRKQLGAERSQRAMPSSRTEPGQDVDVGEGEDAGSVDEGDGETGEVDTGEVDTGEDAPDECAPIQFATFNILWAHDDISSSWYRARTRADWDWKADGVAAALAAANPDIVSLQEVGSIREARDIAARLGQRTGRSYEVIHPDSPFGQQVSLLYDARRFTATAGTGKFAKQVYATVKEPRSNRSFEVVAVQLPQRDTDAGHYFAEVTGELPTRSPAVILGDLDRAAWKSTLVATLEKKDFCTKPVAQSKAVVSKRGDGGADAIIVCGGDLVKDSLKVGEPTNIWNYEADGTGRPWSEVPINDPPFRDVSDHLPVFAQVQLPCVKGAEP